MPTEKSSGEVETEDIKAILQSTEDIADKQKDCDISVVLFDGFSNITYRNRSRSFLQNETSISESSGEDNGYEDFDTNIIKRKASLLLQNYEADIPRVSSAVLQNKKNSTLRKNSITTQMRRVPTEINPTKGWIFTHQLFHSSFIRLSHSNGFLRAAYDIIGDVVAIVEPQVIPLSIDISECSTLNASLSTNNVEEKIRLLITEGTSYSVHPTLNTVLVLLSDMYVLATSIRNCSGSFDKVNWCLRSLILHSKSLLEHLEMFVQSGVSASVGKEAISLLDKALCDLYCGIEGAHRIREIWDSFHFMLRNDEVYVSSILSKNSQFEDVEEYLKHQFSPQHRKEIKLSPTIAPGWIEALHAEEKDINDIIDKRLHFIAKSTNYSQRCFFASFI